MATWFDLGRRTIPEVWRSLRHRRAAPPVPSGSDARADTFRAALEQAEQQFRAAALIDYDSRALNLFYGLSQAGRAIAAAATSLPNDDWRLNGHGLELPGLDGVGKDIRIVSVKTVRGERTSFRRLSTVFNSAQPDSVTIAELWPLLYETNIHSSLGSTLYPPLDVNYRVDRIPSGEFEAQTADVALPATLIALDTADRPPIAAYFARYPSLDGWLTTAPDGTTVGWPTPNMGLTLRWENPTDLDRPHVLDGRLTPYRQEQFAYPTLEGDADGLTVHPLMAWWMVLYAMSMLTRYQPDQWTQMIDVNRSEHATAVEFVLETALASVPDLVDEAIDQVSNAGV